MKPLGVGGEERHQIGGFWPFFFFALYSFTRVGEKKKERTERSNTKTFSTNP
jgi:hypothetical protein